MMEGPHIFALWPVYSSMIFKSSNPSFLLCSETVKLLMNSSTFASVCFVLISAMVLFIYGNIHFTNIHTPWGSFLQKFPGPFYSPMDVPEDVVFSKDLIKIGFEEFLPYLAIGPRNDHGGPPGFELLCQFL